MESIKIGNINIGQNYRPFIIAEMSGNHNQSLDKALEITEAVAKTGAPMLKLQTYTPDTMTLNIDNGDFFIKDKKSLWKNNSLYELYKIAHTPWDWHEPIMKRAKELGLLCFSSPFDETAVDFLEDLNVPAYKIASFENTDLPLIKKVAKTGKPMIISTGMATISEIDETVRTIRELGCEEFILLKCTSSYPSNPLNSNISTISHMRKLFKCQVGLSDHTLGVGSAIAAIAHGATVIEKHFTLNREDEGVDSAFSMQPEEMKLLVNESKSAWQSLGKIFYGPTKSEKKSLGFRRSLYISRDMKKDEILTKDNLRVIRPGYGLPPKYFEVMLGKKINRDVKKGTAVDWSIIS